MMPGEGVIAMLAVKQARGSSLSAFPGIMIRGRPLEAGRIHPSPPLASRSLGQVLRPRIRGLRPAARPEVQ